MQLEIRLLGSVAVERGGVPVPLGGPKQRAVLALLAARPGAVVSTDVLVDALWGEEPPRTAATALHGHVSQLRRVLSAPVIVTRPPGYALELAADAVDARRFERLVEEAHDLPPLERVSTLRTALGLWGGPALADLVGASVRLHEEAERLEELRRVAEERLFDAELALARHAEALPELEALVRDEPLRERAVAQLMLALYRSGRQADALGVYRRFRHELNETLGLDPDQELRELERRILSQDPTLAPPATDPRPAAPRRLPLTVAAVGLEPDGDAGLDVEAYAKISAQVREAVRLALERHGGAVERAGGSIVARFGVPAPNEDDALRATLASRAALAAVDALRDESGARLPIHARAGVATGESFGGESPAVERALRLQAGAAPGELVVDDETRARARPRDLRLDRPLAGRAPERRRLAALFDNAVRDRRSAFVTLVGPAGIGKSRLAEDLAASAASARVLRTRCLSYGDGIGLLPAAELVRGAAGLAADAAADAARVRLTELLADDDRAGAAVEQLVDVLGLGGEVGERDHGWAVRRLLEVVGERSPLLAIVEDLHWADSRFVEIVERLADPIAAPVVVVATARDVPGARLGGDVLELAPLEPAACEQIVTELLGAEIESRSLRLLVERSGGNPLYLEEIVRDLRESGRLHAGEAWRLDDVGAAPPPPLQSLLASHLESLPEAELDLLSRCAVLGRAFRLVELAALAAGAETAEPLAAAVRDGLLQPSPGSDDLEFRHVLIRDAAYASLSLESKAELHERFAHYLETDADSGPEREALAVYHLDQAHRARSTLTPHAPRLVAAATELAARTRSLGRALLARGDAAAASALLARTVELDPDDRLAAVLLGRARLDTGELQAADDAFALAANDRPDDRARLGRLEVRLHTDPTYDLDAAGREVATLLDGLRRLGDDDGTVEALLASAYVSLMRGRIEELGATLEEALAVARRSGRSRAEAEMLFLLCGSCWYGPLAVPEGIARCEEVLAAARERPIVEAAALQALAVLRAMGGEYETARSLVARSRSIRREMGQVVGAAASAIDAGIVELLAGEHAAAERVLRGGYAELEQLGETGYFSTLAALLAEALEAQGRLDEARELARAAASAAAAWDAASQVGWRAAEARALARAGASADAEQVAREAVRIADATDLSLLRGEAWSALADVAAAAGDAAGGEQARANAIEVLERKGLAPPAVAAWARVPV